jgi:5-carboxyvanillate decarboxylase
MRMSRRSLLRNALAAGALWHAGPALAQRAGRADDTGPVPFSKSYKRIATEEAWTTAEIADAYMRLIASNPSDEPGFMALGGRYYAGGSGSPIVANMLDLGAGRVAAMDRLGIDKQLLLLTAPGVQVFEPAMATALAADSNDQLAAAIAERPGRLAGLAAVAPQEPAKAAKEIERAMTKLGLNGVVINSHTKGEFLDEQKFWPMLEAAEAHGAPIYIHPRNPAPAMLEPYLERGLEAGILGFAADVALHTIALIVAGAFDRFPNLKLVIGHGGEGIPYMLYRIDYMQRVVREGRGAKKLEKRPSDYMKENVYITTSGMAWEPAIKFAQAQLGVERVLYAMDYPYQADAGEVRAMDALDISDADKKRFFQTNAETVFSL